VLNGVGEAQKPGSWAAITSGAGTDSVSWSFNWGTDSLLPGENYVCITPLEMDAATTNNEGLGSPFAGNPETYPIYGVGKFTGIADGRRAAGVGVLTLSVFPNPCPGKARITYSLPRSGNINLKLYDVTGKLVATLVRGYRAAGKYNTLLTPTLSSERRGGMMSSERRGSNLVQGVYLLRLETNATTLTRKLIIE
jgi:hypothetical protein